MVIEPQLSLPYAFKKVSLGTGPWLHEFDYYTWLQDDEYVCEVKRMDLGHLCGYVKFKSEGIKYKEQDFRGVPVHGGVTYIDIGDEWIVVGFDCAHAHDLSPGIEQILQRDGDPTPVRERYYKDITYTIRETTHLAQEISKLRSGL